ncbi:MAG: sigma-70 family RNA polymerase sigma factor [Phycisphaerales bacterium]|nr:sigma-70 family RNA polymerase sigma factor [Phycisphaerales bacterium]
MPTPPAQPSGSAVEADRWLDEHGAALYAYAMRRVRDAALAEDLLQETLLAAIADPDRFEGRSSVRTWLFGILRNKLLDHWRRAGRSLEQTVAGLEAAERLTAEKVEELFTDSGSWRRFPRRLPASLAEREEVLAGLQHCLDRLPPRMAETFLLRERHGMPVERLCQDYGTSATNMWQILHRARAALRDCLEGTLAKPRPRRGN